MMIDRSLAEFTDILASASPVPGGGGAAALAGALGVALGSMVGNLTAGKKKYESVQEDIAGILKKASALRSKLLKLIEEDAEVFEPLSKAYGLPKNTPEETEHRNNVMEACLKAACEVPFKIMRSTIEVIALHEELALKGASLVLSDVGVGVAMCRAALSGAVLNIYVNTKYIRDREYAEALNVSASSLLSEGLRSADNVYTSVEEKLRS